MVVESSASDANEQGADDPALFNGGEISSMFRPYFSATKIR